jgi:hypothetical protein
MRDEAMKDFEDTMSKLTEMFFEDETASCMDDILVDYLQDKGYTVTEGRLIYE